MRSSSRRACPSWASTYITRRSSATTRPVCARVIRDRASDRADIIITTGGLGPTLDDLTKETLATVFGKKMALHQPSLDRLTEFFNKIGREMTKNNEKQAWLPEGCTVFDQSRGALRPAVPLRPTASTFSCCPALRASAHPMWKESRRCRICIRWRAAASYRTTCACSVWARALWRTCCTSMMADHGEPDHCTVCQGIRVLRTHYRQGGDRPSRRKNCWSRWSHRWSICWATDVYGVDAASLEQVVGDGLRERGMTLSVAESCTGGLLSKRITDLPGASDYYQGRCMLVL